MDKFSSMLEKLVKVILLFSLCFIPVSFLVCNFVFVRGYQDVFSIKEWIWFFPTVLFMLFVLLLLGKTMQKKRKWILLFFAVIANVGYWTIILTFDTKPCSDWNEIWNIANQIYDNQFVYGAEQSPYVYTYPFQLGLALFEVFIFKTIGNSYIIFQIINIICMNLLSYLVYSIAKNKINEQAAVWAYGASSIFLCWMMSVGQFMNHQIASVFLLLALIAFDEKKYSYSILAGFLLAIGNILRPVGIIAVLSILCITVYEIIKKNEIRKKLLMLVLAIGTYFVVINIADFMIVNAGYSDVGLSASERYTYHKLTCDLFDSKVDECYSDYNYDFDLYQEACKNELKTFIQTNPKTFVLAIANRFCRYMGLFDYGFEMTYNHDETIWQKYPIKALYSIQWFQYVLYAILAIVGYWNYKKSHDLDIYQVYFIGNTLVYIFIEAFTLYRFESYFYFVLLAGNGMRILWNRRFEENDKRED